MWIYSLFYQNRKEHTWQENFHSLVPHASDQKTSFENVGQHHEREKEDAIGEELKNETFKL